jgi:hypothetical protein
MVQLTFGGRRETVRMRLHADSELNTLVIDQPRVADLNLERETATVETIDNFCRDHAIDCIDLLKVDVQGWELEVLRGADAILSRNAIGFIISGVAFCRSDVHMQEFGELSEFMQKVRFFLAFMIYRYGSAKQFVGFSNALYVNIPFVCKDPKQFRSWPDGRSTLLAGTTGR